MAEKLFPLNTFQQDAVLKRLNELGEIVPEAQESDAGKVIKVGEDGSYELGEAEKTLHLYLCNYINSEESPSLNMWFIYITPNEITQLNTAGLYDDLRARGKDYQNHSCPVIPIESEEHESATDNKLGRITRIGYYSSNKIRVSLRQDVFTISDGTVVITPSTRSITTNSTVMLEDLLKDN